MPYALFPIVRVALVHEYLNQLGGGAERVLEALYQIYPGAPVYTSIYDEERMPQSIRRMNIHTSFMQRLPGALRHHRRYLALYPLAFEQFDLRGYDLVISNSSAHAKGVITRPETCHICYCLTPMRWAWNEREYVEHESIGRLARKLLPFYTSYIRMWDQATANRVDYFVAISEAVARRIRKYYRRDAAVIHPAIDTRAFHSSSSIGDYFLVVSRLAPYKRVDLAVEACIRLKLPLKVVGEGRDRERLQRLAGPTIEFLGFRPDNAVRDLYARCRAFIFPGEEDFGLTPLEAQASGRPVIAYAAGGALDTIVPDVTGLFFKEQTVDSLARALTAFHSEDFDPTRIQAHARTFDIGVFRGKFEALVEAKLREFRGSALPCS